MAAAASALALFACDRPAEAPAPARPATPAEEPRPPAPVAESPTVQRIRARGRLLCGVHPGLPGFAFRDTRGVWRGFDVDLCRAVAAAVLGDGDRVTFRPLRNDQRVEALLSGRVDLVARNVTWTMARDAAGVDFAGVSYYDGQGFLVRRALNLQGAGELNGAAVCVQRGTTNVANLADWARGLGIEYREVLVADEAEGRARLQDEACDALSGDISALASTRTILNTPNAYVLLPDVISREPLGPMVREEDSGWRDVVRWTLNALVLAEQAGVTQETVEEATTSARSPEVRRLLGTESALGQTLGLRADWAAEAIGAVGNYGEMFERNLGAGTPLELRRGLNALWSAQPAGLMYPLPLGTPEAGPPTPPTSGRATR